MLKLDSKVRSILNGSLGNLIEWYDWYVYSAFSLYFAQAFFPSQDLTVQLLNSAAIFAVGFLMRPLGGLLMGWYADQHGRKAALTFSVNLMCLGSLMIALVPTYNSIGIISPLILLSARLLQGLSVGGEYGASATYLSEMAGKDNRGFYSSFQYVTIILGQLSSLLILVILQRCFLSQEQLEGWGWRIPFFLGALGALAVRKIREGMLETESFLQVKKKSGAKELFKNLLKYPKSIAIVVGMTLGGTVAFYTYTSYMQKFLVTTLGFPKDTASLISFFSLFIFMCLQPLVGSLSDKIGRRPILLAFGALGSLLTVPLMTALSQTQNVWVAFGLIMIALVIMSGYTSINAIVKAELFPAEIRAVGVGFPYALTVSIFGGSAEYFALWTKNIGHESWFFWYVSFCIGCSFLVYYFMHETKDKSYLQNSNAKIG